MVRKELKFVVLVVLVVRKLREMNGYELVQLHCIHFVRTLIMDSSKLIPPTALLALKFGYVEVNIKLTKE